MAPLSHKFDILWLSLSYIYRVFVSVNTHLPYAFHVPYISVSSILRSLLCLVSFLLRPPDAHITGSQLTLHFYSEPGFHSEFRQFQKHSNHIQTPPALLSATHGYERFPLLRGPTSDVFTELMTDIVYGNIRHSEYQRAFRIVYGLQKIYSSAYAALSLSASGRFKQ